MPLYYQEDSVRKFGRNPAVGTTTEDIWTVGGVRAWLSTAVTLEAISDNVNDTLAGTGAQIITVVCLDENFDAVELDLNMNGTSATLPSTVTAIRTNRAFVKQVGTYGGTNIGNITIRVSGAGATQTEIIAGKGQTEQSHYSVPRNKEFLMNHCWYSVEATQEVALELYKRLGIDTVIAPFIQAKRKVFGASGLVEPGDHDFKIPERIIGPADIWWEGAASVGSAVVEAGFTGEA